MEDTIRFMQLERTIGELRVLKASYFNSMGEGQEKYKEVSTLINRIINDLENTL